MNKYLTSMKNKTNCLLWEETSARIEPNKIRLVQVTGVIVQRRSDKDFHRDKNLCQVVENF